MAASSKSLSLQEVIDGIFASDSDTDSSKSDSNDEIEDVDPCDRVSILFVDDNDTRKVVNAPYWQETDMMKMKKDTLISSLILAVL